MSWRVLSGSRCGALLALLVACRSAPVPDHSASGAARTGAKLEPLPSRTLASPAPASAVPAAAAERVPELQPLVGAWLEPLAELGAVVTLPLGAASPRPIVVGVHGAGDRPEWSCGGWRLASGGSTFVLCPRGSKQDAQRFAWASSRSIEQALEAALLELRRRFGPYLDETHAVYAGFSQGASLAEPILRARARQFPIAILAEGGYDTARSPDFARAYRANGGRRVVLVCGSRGCFSSAARAKPVLEQAGLEVQIVGDERAGHNLNQRMQVALQRAWPAMVAAPQL